MAKKKVTPRRSGTRKNVTARKTVTAPKARTRTTPAGRDGNAAKMAQRVKEEFEVGYRGSSTGPVEYEMSDDADKIGADHIFFRELIFRSIRRHHGGGDPPKPEPPDPTKKTARDHGDMVRKIQPTGPIRLVNILSTFYRLKDTMCPDPDGRASVRGKVCNF